MKDKIIKTLYKILSFYARILIKRFNPFVIAITGSVGKSSTKETVYSVMAGYFGREKVRKNYGNLNSDIGIPLTILGYDSYPTPLLWPIFLVVAAFRLFAKKYPKYLILEMGVDSVGDIDNYCKIVRPNFVIITSLAGAHLANFDTKSKYQEEKLKLLKYLPEDGLALVNADDANLGKIEDSRIETVACDSAADYKAENIKIDLSGTSFDILSTGRKIHIKSPLIGSHLVYTDLFAFGVAKHFQIQSLEIGNYLPKKSFTPGRMNLVEGKDNCKIIDDTYNANPTSVVAAAKTLSQIDWDGRKVMIIGNMNELGKTEREDHLDVAEKIKSLSIDKIIFVGPHAKYMSDVIGDRAVYFASPVDVIKNLSSLISSHDLILVKASQNNNYFEEIVKHIMRDRSQSKENLVRQSSSWKKAKRKIYGKYLI